VSQEVVLCVRRGDKEWIALTVLGTIKRVIT
jgi:hypothetical protein